MTSPLAASTTELPAGASVVSVVGSPLMRSAELRAASPDPPTSGKSSPATSSPASTTPQASLSSVVVSLRAFSDIAGQGTCYARGGAPVSRGARAGPGCGGCRSACPCPGRSAPPPSSAAPPGRGPGRPPCLEGDVARGRRPGADRGLRVGPGDPVGQPLLAGGQRHPLGVHAQR